MNPVPTILLAEGFPVPLIFMAGVVVLWLIGSILAQAQRSDDPASREQRQRVRDQLRTSRRDGNQRTPGQYRQPPPPIPQAPQPPPYFEPQAQRQPDRRPPPPPLPGNARPTQSKRNKQRAAAAAQQAMNVQKARAVAEAAAQAEAAAAKRRERVAEAAAAEAASRSAKPTNETARNVRLMLQSAGIREAFVLNEVLGKPKSLEG